MSRPVNTVVVVGRDAAAWLTAFGLRYAFGRTGVAVTVVELPSMLSPVDVYPSLPTLGGLHGLLGVDEREAVAACAGVYCLGQRFANWSGGSAPFVHAYDTQPIGLNNVSLLQYWVKARGEGLAIAFDDFSLGATMAKQGRIELDADVSDSFSRPAHGYQFDAVAYVAMIKQRALRAGVTVMAGGVGAVKVEGERITSITLADGRTVEADLFVDASGAEAVLMRHMPGDGFESWSRWLACDRMLTASGQRLDPLPAYAQIAAFQAGWIGLYPLQDRTAIVACYDSGKLSDGEMLNTLPVLTGMRLQGEAVASALAPGYRPRPWIGNCVAIGETAVALEPLDAVSLHIVQTGLSHLISFFPVDADHMLEAGVYNAGLARHAENIRDFQIAHYRLNQRRDEPFWDRAREMSLPPTLDYKMQLFSARGAVALYDDEAFQASNWASIFIGHGLMPRAYDPLVDMLAHDDQVMQLKRMLSFIAQEVKAMPALESQLRPAQPRTNALY
ncbi:MAG: hypothetical protein JWP35_1149 [Caulobacter sp.]|nr:hypothetical protein [Caulobacter sp.]